MPEAKRTLVKSAPELWAEVSDAAALARHLAPFGSVSITGTRPEALVEWSGEKASGTVALESSGFGTRVTVRAVAARAAAPPPQPPPEPRAEPASGFWARVFRRRPEPEPVAPPPAHPEPEGEPLIADDAALLVLTDMLDALGRAHHRPFSRA